ncbi:Di-sulfide bridge nucleocytoplasmic transport domain-containing protein [Ephemerocybe angulata]|uniref:Di-sulfide bridge nucleocytoplasmic transport domain-containing protein n=1 Tax=Ephemerocybe angulata TaxID=980116 RepID=A0A8H6HL69_9AGAR|nr:Di-sulfide bridge nucleocytoplasmic transport domain-containing protein [Tulosesus angulatus]
MEEKLESKGIWSVAIDQRKWVRVKPGSPIHVTSVCLPFKIHTPHPSKNRNSSRQACIKSSLTLSIARPGVFDESPRRVAITTLIPQKLEQVECDFWLYPGKDYVFEASGNWLHLLGEFVDSDKPTVHRFIISAPIMPASRPPTEPKLSYASIGLNEEEDEEEEDCTFSTTNALYFAPMPPNMTSASLSLETLTQRHMNAPGLPLLWHEHGSTSMAHRSYCGCFDLYATLTLVLRTEPQGGPGPVTPLTFLRHNLLSRIAMIPMLWGKREKSKPGVGRENHSNRELTALDWSLPRNKSLEKANVHQNASIFNLIMPHIQPSAAQRAMSITAKLTVLLVFFACGLVTAYVIWHDVRKRALAASESIASERSHCSSLYAENHCGHMRAPVFDKMCQEWLECSQQDITAINHLSLLGSYISEACNSLIHGMSWQSKVFLLAFVAITLKTQCAWGERLIECLFSAQ